MEEFDATDKGNMSAQFAEAEIADIGTIDFHGGTGQVGIPADGIKEAALTGATATAEGQLLACGHGQLIVGRANQN